MSKDNKIIPFPERGRNEALRRIRMAAENSWDRLDLSNLGLDSLPRELEMLKGLQHLLLGSNKPVLVEGKYTYVLPTFTDISPVAALTDLRFIDLSGATRLQDLSPLSSLVKLHELSA